jgi:hypothetical protein
MKPFGRQRRANAMQPVSHDREHPATGHRKGLGACAGPSQTSALGPGHSSAEPDITSGDARPVGTRSEIKSRRSPRLRRKCIAMPVFDELAQRDRVTQCTRNWRRSAKLTVALNLRRINGLGRDGEGDHAVGYGPRASTARFTIEPVPDTPTRAERPPTPFPIPIGSSRDDFGELPAIMHPRSVRRPRQPPPLERGLP